MCPGGVLFKVSTNRLDPPEIKVQPALIWIFKWLWQSVSQEKNEPGLSGAIWHCSCSATIKESVPGELIKVTKVASAEAGLSHISGIWVTMFWCFLLFTNKTKYSFSAQASLCLGGQFGSSEISTAIGKKTLQRMKIELNLQSHQWKSRRQWRTSCLSWMLSISMPSGLSTFVCFEKEFLMQDPVALTWT